MSAGSQSPHWTRTLSVVASLMSRHRQPDVVLRQAGRGGARAHDVLELRALQALSERVVVVEAVQERGHPPREVLGAPDPPQRRLGVAIEQVLPARFAELD